jgi:NADPH:quinone reductase-like Zn-dependent oxidoreductase
MKVAVLEKIKKISIEEREIPKPKEDEVLVRVKSIYLGGFYEIRNAELCI